MGEISLTMIILGFVGGITILINPFLGLLATSGLIPLSLFPAIAGSFLGVFSVATPIKIAGTLTFVSSFIRHISERKSWDFLKKPQMRFFMLFLAWIFISGFTQPGFAARENFTLFISFAVLGFIILSLIDSIKRFRWVLWAALIPVFIVSLNAVLNYLSFGQAIRVSGASYGPNYFAIGLLPFLGIAFYNISTEKKKILKIFSLIITLVIASALVFTFSRAGLVGFSGMLLTATLKAKKKIRAFLLLVICLTLLINVLPSQVWERFGQTEATLERLEETSNVNSTKRRLLLAKAAWKMFLEHPLVGVGVGNYYYECRKYAPIHAGRAHTTYLEIMAELGIIGIFLFLGILFNTFKILKKIIKSNCPVGGYARGLWIGLVGFLIAAIFLHAQQEKALWFVVFMAAALERIVRKKAYSD